MSTITWSDALSVGIAQMDREHQELVRLLNGLADAVNSGRGRDVLDATLAGLAEYTAGHLAREEELLKAHDYPDLHAHRREHQELMRKFGELQGRLQRGATLSLSLDVLGFLVAWLTDHIQNSDKEYGVYLNARGLA